MTSALFNADCLDILEHLDEQSVDLVCCDPPYGTTNNPWDAVIGIAAMWEGLFHVLKPTGNIVLMAHQPFASELIYSNTPMFSHQIIWVKNSVTGYLNAKKLPVRKHEQILVFSENKAPYCYNPQNLVACEISHRERNNHASNYGSVRQKTYTQTITNYPADVIYYDVVNKALHPTQKPVALMSYLIETYSDPEDTVLDFSMGSGTTGCACKDTGREFIGIEMDEYWFHIAKNRINAH